MRERDMPLACWLATCGMEAYLTVLLKVAELQEVPGRSVVL